MERVNGEWQIYGDQALLRLEREVHQLARRMRCRPLRLEATCWSAPTLCANLTPDWMLGRSDIVGVNRSFQLLEDRVVDCMIAGLPDLPTSSHPSLTSIQLTRMPVFFTCAPGHPLLKQQHLDYADIAEFPLLAPPHGTCPLVEHSLKSIGLWNDELHRGRSRRDGWERLADSEVAIGYATPLSMNVRGGSLCRLPLLLPFDSGDALVVCHDFLAHPLLEELIDCLLTRIHELVGECPEIDVVYR